MSKITAVTNNKGGVGKTHTVFHLAGAYAEKGKRVLVIDLDPQGNLTGLLSPVQEPEHTLYSVLVDDRPLSDAVHKTPFPNISLVPAHPQLQSLDALLQTEPDAQIRLADALKEYLTSNSAVDHILLDCPPSLALTTRNALAAAHQVIIPLEADKFSIDGLDSLLRVISSVKRVLNPDLQIAGILVSLFTGRRSIETMYEQALRGRDMRVFTTRIKNSVKYREAITAQQPITYYRPKGEFADAFRDLIKELEHVHV